MSAWHFVLNGEKIGPVSEETLKEKISSGEITADIHLLNKGWSCWTPAHQTDIYKQTLGITDASLQAEDSSEGDSPIVISPKGELSIKEAFTFGWHTTKSKPAILIPVFFIVLLVPYIFSIFQDLTADNFILSLIIGLLSVAVSFLVNLGAINIVFKFAAGKKPKDNDFFNCYPFFLKYIGASILYIIVVSVGMILLVIPGILLAIALQFFSLIIIDKGFGAIDSLKQSYAITKENWRKIFIFDLVFGFVILAGVLCAGVGILISFPVAMLAYAHFYRQLVVRAELYQRDEPAKDDTFSDVAQKPVEQQTEAPPEPQPEPVLPIVPEPELTPKDPGEDFSDISIDDLTIVDEPEEPIEPEPEDEEEKPPEPKKPLKFQFSKDTDKKPEEDTD